VPLALDEVVYRDVRDRAAVFDDTIGSNAGTWVHLMAPSGKFVARLVREDAVAVLKRGLESYSKLPEADRKPPAKVLDDLEKRSRVGRRPLPTPPANGLVLKTITSHLERGPDGELIRAKEPFAADLRDSLWLTEAEWKALVPANPRQGDQHAVAPAVQDRLVRYCLWDNYRSGDGARGVRPWRRAEVRSSRLTLTAEAVSADALRLCLRGTALIASDADVAKSKIGYEAALFGYLDYDRRAQRITRFDVASVADSWWFEPLHWQGQFEHYNQRVGRIVVGVAFELAPCETAFYLVPPRFLGDPEYFGKSK